MLEDRIEAGARLAAELKNYGRSDNTVVLALPRGGVPVAAEIATALELPLDVLVVRKLGAPGRAELAMGAISASGVRVVNEDIVRTLGIDEEQLEDAASREAARAAEQEESFRGGRPAPELAGKRVIIVDDGLATGASMRAAVQAVRASSPREIVVAVPVGAPETVSAIRSLADELVVLSTPPDFRAVGQYYRRFDQVDDEEVRKTLASF